MADQSFFENYNNLDGKEVYFRAFNWPNDKGPPEDTRGEIEYDLVNHIRKQPLGGITCDAPKGWNRCFTKGVDGSEVMQHNNGMRWSDKFRVPQGTAVLIRGETNEEGKGYTHTEGDFHKTINIEGIPNHKDDRTNQVIWGPMADLEVLKQQCCLGNIKDSVWCGEYARKSGGVMPEKCIPHLDNYCTDNKLSLSDDFIKHVPPNGHNIPKKKGCWYYNPMDKNGKGDIIGSNNYLDVRNKWVKVDNKDREGCVLPISKELSDRNLHSAVEGTGHDSEIYDPKEYRPPIVVWVENDTVNASHNDMNHKVSHFDRLACGCSAEARAAEKAKHDKEIADFAALAGVSEEQVRDAKQSLLCTSQYCGHKNLEAIHRHQSQVDPNCSGTFNTALCVQKLSAEAREQAKINNVALNQSCLVADEPVVTPPPPPTTSTSGSDFMKIIIIIIVILSALGVMAAVYFILKKRTPHTNAPMPYRPTYRQ